MNKVHISRNFVQQLDNLTKLQLDEPTKPVVKNNLDFITPN